MSRYYYLDPTTQKCHPEALCKKLFGRDDLSGTGLTKMALSWTSITVHPVEPIQSARILIDTDSEQWQSEFEWRKDFAEWMEQDPETCRELWGERFEDNTMLVEAEPNVKGQPGYNPDWALGYRPRRK